MKVRFEWKLAVALGVLSLMGGRASADSFSNYRDVSIQYVRGIDFGTGDVVRAEGWDLSIKPCNCNVERLILHNDLQRGSGWHFTAASKTATVPAAEPATGLFVGLGLAVMGLMRRRRKKPFENTVWENLG